MEGKQSTATEESSDQRLYWANTASKARIATSFFRCWSEPSVATPLAGDAELGDVAERPAAAVVADVLLAKGPADTTAPFPLAL